jgi:2-polyprenyl-3-methyl-5-hydroxy-6-metoxy-1,4-benzoquinol methylase
MRYNGEASHLQATFCFLPMPNREKVRRYAWIIKFPIVLVTTVIVKLRNRSWRSDQEYLKHQQAIYGRKLFTDKSDKFTRVRERIAQLALESGKTRALDVATGAGWQALALKNAGFSQVVGVDVVSQRIAFCRQVHQEKGIKFQVMDGSNLKYPDNYFDCSVVSAALHDMPSPVKKRVLSELARVTKNRVIIFEPRTFQNPILGFLYGTIGEWLDESLHFREFVGEDLGRVLPEQGLEVIHQEPAWHGMMHLTVCQPKSH